MIISNASKKIHEFNEIGLHYNIVAKNVYKARELGNDYFGKKYQAYITAGLISFDMGRMMGQGGRNKYDIANGGFATKLRKKLITIKPIIQHLTQKKLTDLEIEKEKENIIHAYNELSAKGRGGLNQRGDEFHVGTTKVLHFINPELFLIIDSNASRAFKFFHKVKYRNTTQPGYSAAKYIECLELAQKDIVTFGVSSFRALENGVPMARIYDKLTFVTGSNRS